MLLLWIMELLSSVVIEAQLGKKQCKFRIGGEKRNTSDFLSFSHPKEHEKLYLFLHSGAH